MIKYKLVIWFVLFSIVFPVLSSEKKNTKREMVNALFLRIYRYCGPSTQLITYLIFRFLDAPLSPSRTIQAHTRHVSAYQFSWNYHLLVSSGMEGLGMEERPTLKVWNVEDGSLKQTLKFPDHLGFSPRTCLFTSDDQLLITACPFNIRVWAVPTGALIHSFEFQRGICACLLSSDDKYFLCSGDIDPNPTIQMWSLQTFTRAKIFEGHTGRIHWLQFHNFDQEVLSSSSDKTIRIWSVETQTCSRIFSGHHKQIRSCSLSMDKQYLVSGSDDETVKLWHVNTGKNLETFYEHSNYIHANDHDDNGYIKACSFVRQDTWVTSIDYGGTVYVWRVLDGSIVHTFRNIAKMCGYSIFGRVINSYSVNTENGECLILATPENKLRVVEVESGIDTFVFEGHTERIWMGVVSTYGRVLVSAGNDGTIRFWDLKKPNWLDFKMI